MINNVVLLLRAASTDRAELLARLDREAERVWESIGDLPKARVRVFDVVDGLVEGTAHQRSLHGKPFDAAIEAGWDGASLEELVPLFEGAAERLGTEIDAGDSFALAGPLYPMTPRETDLVTFVVISRALSQDWAAHHSHWLNKHAWIVKPGADARGSGYRQFHADPKASSFAAKKAGVGGHEFEGIAMAYFDDAETYRRVMIDPNPAIMEDEARFIDPVASAPGVYRVVSARQAD